MGSGWVGMFNGRSVVAQPSPFAQHLRRAPVLVAWHNRRIDERLTNCGQVVPTPASLITLR